jgi:signal transduction histidine kinase
MSEQIAGGWFRSVLPLGAVLLVVLSFFSVTFVVQRRTEAIDRLAQELETNSIPSILRLTAARAELHRVTIAVRDLVRSGEAGVPRSRQSYEEARSELDVSMAAYLRLPTYPAEARLNALVAKDLADYTRGVETLLAHLDAGNRVVAGELIDNELMPANARVEERQDQLIELNSDEARRASQDIRRARQQAGRLSFALHALAALLAGLVLAAIARWNRSHERLLEARGRVEAERKDFAEQRAAELEVFGARMAHDVKTPLTAIQLHLALAGKKSGDATQLHTALEKADDGIQRVSAMIDGLLAFARSAGHVSLDSSADVGVGIASALSGLSAEVQRVGAHINVEPFKPVGVACSEGMLLCILGNLLGNALKYIVGSHASVRRVVVRVTTNNGKIHVEIADNGPGIPAALQTRIFEPYVRGADTKSPGLGLGLATVKRIVKAHGGALGFRSQVDRGSQFWFELPQAESAPHLCQGAPQLARGVSSSSESCSPSHR